MGVFVGVGDFGLGALLAEAQAALQAAQNLAGIFGPSKTKSEIRTTDSDSGLFFIIDGGPGALAVHNPGDTTSNDDGTSVLVGATGKRYKITTLQSLLLSPQG